MTAVQPNDVPQPTATGSNGTQEAASGSEVVLLKSEPPVIGLPLAETVQGLAATRARSFGGEIGAQLLAGSVAQMSHDLQTTRQELRDTQKDLKQAIIDLGIERTKNAQLAERIAALCRSKHFGNAGVLIGTIVLGVGFDFVKGNQNQMLGLGLSLLGTVLILVSWFSTPKGNP